MPGGWWIFGCFGRSSSEVQVTRQHVALWWRSCVLAAMLAARSISAQTDARPADVDDGELLISKADALVHSRRPSEALPLYRQAVGRGAAVRDVEEKIAVAESQRQTLVAQCEDGSADAALRACELALLPGAEDEFVIQRRRGVLLQGMGETLQALDAYIAASLVQSNDPAVSQAIVALTQSTGRKDAVALAARGNALLTLRRGAEAVRVFKDAQALSPSLPGIEAPLAAAEEMARSEPQKGAPATAARSTEESRALSVTFPARESSSVQVASPPAEAASDSRVALEAKRTYSNREPATRSH